MKSIITATLAAIMICSSTTVVYSSQNKNETNYCHTAADCSICCVIPAMFCYICCVPTVLTEGVEQYTNQASQYGQAFLEWRQSSANKFYCSPEGMCFTKQMKRPVNERYSLLPRVQTDMCMKQDDKKK